MPYIDKATREKVDDGIQHLIDVIVVATQDTPDHHNAIGTLNYSITRVIQGVFSRIFSRRRYWHFPLIKGLLADISDELQDRQQRAYEDQKIKENGDLVEFQ